MSSKKGEPIKLSTLEERVLNTLVDKAIRETKPKTTGNSIIYDGLEELTKEIGEKEILKQLRALKNNEYLIEHNYDSVILCPSCGSIQVYSRYNCPKCQSINIQKVQLIEHTFCGYIGNRTEFESESGLICPKCKTVIGTFLNAQSNTKSDKRKVIRVIGSSFACDKCGSKFERPVTSHVCQKCGATFTYIEADFEKLPSYELAEKVESLSPNRFERDALRQVEALFIQNGYTVELEAKIMGKSGVEQSFDLIAKKGQKLTLLDVSVWGNQTDLISLLGKKMDIDAQSIFLLDLTGKPTLPPLGKPYNIHVLNGKDIKFIDILAQIIGETKNEGEKRGSFWKRQKEK